MTEIRNPILRGFHPDPSICRVGDDYYIATSTFEWYPGVQISHSKDLVNWRTVGQALNRKEQLDMRGNPDSGGVWAPSLSYADGKFWLIYTDVKRLDGSSKDAHNYLVTSETIEGPWSDPIYMNSSGFDPSLFHDDDGRKWFVNMVWNHLAMQGDPNAPTKHLFGGILLQEYDHEAGRLTGPIKNIFPGSDLGLTEAPHLFKRDEYYYLITAEGGTGYGHAVTFARSKTIEGPYELHPNPHLLRVFETPDSPLQRTGHGQYVETQDGTPYHTFLCTRPLPGTRKSPMGRETGITRCRWEDDGWLYLDQGGLIPPAQETAPDLPVYEFEPEPTIHDFSQLESLPNTFMWPRTPESDRIFNLSSEGLVLTGRESIGSWFEQSLVARRQTEWDCEARTKVSFDPEDFQQMAGLTAYYNRTQFHYLGVTRSQDGHRALNILSCHNWPEGTLTFPLDAMFAIPEEGAVWLALSIRRGALQFSYSLDGRAYVEIGPELDAHILSDEGVRGEHSNFTGTYIGMAAQDLTGRAQQATFEFFELSNHP
ncbi:xylan 1,4-beta-xylosidase [Cognatiyoonia sediminum]|uniref:Xylan 1,4-beta-xylosidase n=1 Tax=Cognatiyoonia sediminum TaxID=1508389 RepID=A0A1M5T7V9_9RHOB|nr:glycoside hydrolase family 43 protein [Cognatiyoonia sediminum]SHH46845.1 xylan 1,4-beta-xylosidase [Cognatiyoonia sediminum]